MKLLFELAINIEIFSALKIYIYKQHEGDVRTSFFLDMINCSANFGQISS